MFLFRAITDRKLSWGGSLSRLALRLRNLVPRAFCSTIFKMAALKYRQGQGWETPRNSPYSKMAAILVLFRLLEN